jgi:hypothetical protein
MGNGRQVPLEGHFISAKRYSLSRPDGSFADYKESILGMLVAPAERWIEEAWHTLGEIWDFRPLTHRPWFIYPAVRCLTMTSPAYAREIKGFRGLRPWNFFLVATAIRRHHNEREPQTAIVIAPFERDPEIWGTLSWRFAETGEPVAFDGPSRWRLRTLREFLESYSRHAIPEMLALDGSPCGPYTRGVLRRRPVRDGERWLLLKEAAVYGDDPRHAFSVPSPELIRRPAPANRRGASAAWESTIKPALVIVGPVAVAREMGLAARTVRAWAAGEREPAEPREAARAIVATAREAGLGLQSDEHLRAEEICSELPRRAEAVQFFITFATVMLAGMHGGIRALSRAMAGEGETAPEPTVRRWLSLVGLELRAIGDLNRIVGRLAKFSRSEIKKMRRRIRAEPGPAGDRQAIVAYLSLLWGAEKLGVLSPEDTLALPAVLAIVALLATVATAIKALPPTGIPYATCANPDPAGVERPLDAAQG